MNFLSFTMGPAGQYFQIVLVDSPFVSACTNQPAPRDFLTRALSTLSKAMMKSTDAAGNPSW